MSVRTEELTRLVCEASALFYLVEEGHNPGVKSFWDAFHYVSTALSVGYANVFPVTDAGKAIGGVLMMIGPALAAKLMEPDEALAQLKGAAGV